MISRGIWKNWLTNLSLVLIFISILILDFWWLNDHSILLLCIGEEFVSKVICEEFKSEDAGVRVKDVVDYVKDGIKRQFLLFYLKNEIPVEVILGKSIGW